MSKDKTNWIIYLKDSDTYLYSKHITVSRSYLARRFTGRSQAKVYSKKNGFDDDQIELLKFRIDLHCEKNMLNLLDEVF